MPQVKPVIRVIALMPLLFPFRRFRKVVEFVAFDPPQPFVSNFFLTFFYPLVCTLRILSARCNRARPEPSLPRCEDPAADRQQRGS